MPVNKLSRTLRELVEWLILGMFLGCIPHMHAQTPTVTVPARTTNQWYDGCNTHTELGDGLELVTAVYCPKQTPLLLASTTMPSEKDFGNHKAMLIFKPCPDNKADVCAVPVLNPMFRVKLEKGEQPKSGQAVQCEVTKKKTLDCGHGLEMKLDSVILQAQ